MKPRILLLVPTTTYRAEDFLRAALALDTDVTVASEDPSSVAHLSPADFLTFSFSDLEDASRKALALHRSHPIRSVVSVDDQSAVAAAEIARGLGLTHNSVASVNATRDKFLMRERLREGGVPQPGYWRVSLDGDPSEWASRVGFPCVLKPRGLSASRGVIRADDPSEFAAAFHRIRSLLERPDVAPDDDSLLVEEFVPGFELAVEGLVREGKLDVLAVFDKPDPLDGPYFPESLYLTPSRLPDRTLERVSGCVQSATRALGLVEGPVHAELREREGELRFLEVAARSIGGLCSRVLRFGVGMSLEELILRHAMGLEIPTLERESLAAGVMMVPAMEAGEFRAVRGLERARSVEHVEEIDLSVHSGQRLEPLPEGGLYMAFLFARAETPDQVESALRKARSMLDFDFYSSR